MTKHDRTAFATTTQISHDDLDGYGCSTVLAATVAVDRVEHVTRYADVAPVFAAELERLRRTSDPELLVVTDIAVEQGLADGIAAFAAMNRGRAAPHGLVVVDHHASTRDSLAAAGFATVLPTGGSTSLTLHRPPGQEAAGDPMLAPVLILVDPARSATGLCLDHAGVFARRAAPSPTDVGPTTLRALVEAVDAVDLWDRARPAFDAGEALNEAFWECVATYVPAGHELHDAFVSRILLATAVRIAAGREADAVESAANEIRREAVSWLVAKAGIEETPRQARSTTRMRASLALTRSTRLFVEPLEGASLRLCFAIDAGVFQRVADFLLDAGAARIVVNVRRGGAMMFRSRHGEALELARRFGGGGHRDSAGARLGTDAVFSLDEAVRQFRGTLETGPLPAGTTWQA